MKGGKGPWRTLLTTYIIQCLVDPVNNVKGTQYIKLCYHLFHYLDIYNLVEEKNPGCCHSLKPWGLLTETSTFGICQNFQALYSDTTLEYRFIIFSLQKCERKILVFTYFVGISLQVNLTHMGSVKKDYTANVRTETSTVPPRKFAISGNLTLCIGIGKVQPCSGNWKVWRW